ncbi:MAG TPA: hypothetical protein VGN39_04015, partial [Terriglobales bacterium]|nr:hypothetical protein [Terriglobales bacterium]
PRWLPLRDTMVRMAGKRRFARPAAPAVKPIPAEVVSVMDRPSSVAGSLNAAIVGRQAHGNGNLAGSDRPPL